jgi:lipoate-protein ligase A
MLQVLRIGREKLSDKATQSAAKRVDPLRSQTGMPRAEVIERMLESFRKAHGLAFGKLEPAELARAQELAASKFSTDAWTGIVP